MNLKRFLISTMLMLVVLFFSATAFSQAPYMWPSDTNGDLSAYGNGANWWDYHVDYHSAEGDDTQPMKWSDANERWEDPYNFEDPVAAWIGENGNMYNFVGSYNTGLLINPKLVLYPRIDLDLEEKSQKRFKLKIDFNALPGGASLRIFTCDSDDYYGGPDTNFNRTDLFGTADDPVVYQAGDAIKQTWSITVGEASTEADMNLGNWLIVEFEDPDTEDEIDGGGEVSKETENSFWFFEDRCPLISEIVASTAEGQFIELANPTDEIIDLSDVYISNSPAYYGVVKQSSAVDNKSGANGYFNAKFPEGTTLPGGQYIVVALDDGFSAAYGTDPDFILASNKAGTAMEEAFPYSVSGQGDLRKAGEALMLYKWDQDSDRVYDCDYALWGDGSNYMDKTGITIDGIDADESETEYKDDTAKDNQSLIADAAHADGESFGRCDFAEGTEIQTGDNNGYDPDFHDETSENLVDTWQTLAAPSPGEANDCPDSDDDDDADDDDETDDDDDSSDDSDEDDDEGCCG